MTDKLLIDRELLAKLLQNYYWQLHSANALATYSGGTGDDEKPADCAEELRAILAAPRQQLAERDAEILEQCRLNGMGAERELKLLTQRDKLAGLLREVISGLRCENLHHKKAERHAFDEPCKVLARIDAALAEVKP